jgi:hypothetical protein
MGFLSRINRLHIIAAGGVIFVVLLVAFALSFLQPTLQEIKQVRADQQKQEGIWRQLPQKVAVLGAAQQMLATSKEQAEAFVASMPTVAPDPFDGFAAMFLLHQEFTYGAGPALFRFFVSRGYPPAGISVPAPPWQPAAPTPMLTLPMAGFGVQAKSFPAVLALLRDLKNMPRLGVIGGISLRGTSPNLYVSMPLTIYIVTKQALSPLGLMAAAGAAAAPAAGAPGARRGAPGGIKLSFGARRSR